MAIDKGAIRTRIKNEIKNATDDGSVTHTIMADILLDMLIEEITSELIASGAITTDKIANYAVETSKLGDRAVTSAKIDTGAVTTSKIDDRAVTFEKLDPNMIDDVATPDSVNLINSGGVRDSIDEAVAGMSIDITEYIQDDTKSLKVGGYNYTYGMTPLDVFVYQVSSSGVIPTVYALFRSSDGTYFLFSGILGLQEQTVTYKATYNTFGDLPGRAQRAVYAGADDNPTANSQNIVKSGGVHAAVATSVRVNGAQNFNDTQKAQARENIDALDSIAVEELNEIFND